MYAQRLREQLRLRAFPRSLSTDQDNMHVFRSLKIHVASATTDIRLVGGILQDVQNKEELGQTCSLRYLCQEQKWHNESRTKSYKRDFSPTRSLINFSVKYL